MAANPDLSPRFSEQDLDRGPWAEQARHQAAVAPSRLALALVIAASMLAAVLVCRAGLHTLLETPDAIAQGEALQ